MIDTASRLARIEELERAIEAARRRVREASGGGSLTKLERKIRALEGHVAGLERRAARGRAFPQVKNPVAAAFALLSVIALVVGALWSARLVQAPLVWVEDRCRVTSYDDDVPVATPHERPSAHFSAAGAAVGTTVRCWIPNEPIGDGLGLLVAPARPTLSPSEKVKKLPFLLLVEGLAVLAFTCWIAFAKPSEDG